MNLIVDFNNTVHRARAGFQRGENSIVYTFMLMLKKMVSNFRPHRVYIVKEGKARKRREMFEDYKANRESAGDDFWRQHSKIVELLSKTPVHIIRHPERECDDTIAHICRELHEDEECTIISSDSDFIQLLSADTQRIKLYNPIKESYVEHTHYDYVSWKSLVGDGSDNIPGFPGIGPKRAEKLLSTPETLEIFLAQQNNREIYERNLKLITFETIEGDLEHTLPATDWVELRESLTNLGFNSIVNDKSWSKFVQAFSTIGA
jgi:5'-3' exonuclease